MAVAEVRTAHGWERVFYLGSDEPLFVVTHEPDGCDGRAVVVCSPLLTDQVANYSREVRLARELAARGVACVRFHYRGTGCSGGDRDRVTFDSTVRDAAEIVAWSPWSVLGAVGTRLSVHIAAAALRGAPDAPLVAWDPVLTSSQFFRDAFRARLAREVARGEGRERSAAAQVERLDREGGLDLAGARLAAATYHSMQQLDLAESLASRSGPVLVVGFQADPAAGPLGKIVEGARAEGREVSLVGSPQGETWWFTSERILPSRELGDLTVDWLVPRLTEAAAAAPQSRTPAVPAARSDRAMPVAGVNETAVYIPAGDVHAFGVLARSASAAPPAHTVLQCWGGGGYPNFGPDQIRARLSRALARRGCADLRIDYAGIGDSTGTPIEFDLRAPWAPEARFAATWLRAQFPGLPTVLVGTCYGTRVALQLVDAIEPAGVVLLNPPVRDDHHLESIVAQQGLWVVIKHGLRGSTLRGWLNPRRRARRLRMFRRALQFRRGRVPRSEERNIASPAFARPVQDLVERGVPLLIVTLGENSFHAEFSKALSGRLGELIVSRPEQVEIVTLPGIALTATSAVQDQTVAAVTDWYDRHFAGAELSTTAGPST